MKLLFSFKLSAKAVGILFTIIVFFIAAWKNQIGLLYLAASFLISLLIVSAVIVILQAVSGGIKIKRKIRDVAVEGNILDVSISLSNDGIFTLYNLQAADNFTASLLTKPNPLIFIEQIPSGKTIEAQYSGECFKRGFYNIGPVTLTFADPFGLFFLSKKYQLFNSLLVYPQTFKICRFPQLHGRGHVSWYGIETSHISGDEHEFYGIREYKPKDRLTNIHWRSSARLQTLIVRQFERCSETQLTIMFDLMRDSNIGSGRETTVEYAIKIAASLAKYLIENKYSVQILAHEKNMIHIPFGKGEGHLSRILKLLSTVEAEGVVPLSQLLAESEPLIPGHSELLLIALDTDSAALDRAVSLIAKGVSVRPFVLFSPSFAYFQKEDMIKKYIKAKQIKIFSSSKMMPYFFYRGDNLETKFFETVR